MRLHSWLVVLLVVASGLWNVDAASDDSEGVKLVTTGLVEKVDAKHKTFEFKFYLDQPRVTVRQNPYPGGRMGRRGRIGGYPGRNFPPPDNSMEVKVFVSEATKLKGPFNAIVFSDLKSGDRVTVTATHHGHGDDLDAEVVSRN
jgi:hypothetical protein